jgi:formylglycine-generating enzyme required for sulfatase activity
MRKISFLAFLAVSLAGAAAEVSQVSLSEVGDELVVSYKLSADAIVVVDIQTNAADGAYASLGGRHQWTLNGDVNRLVAAGDSRTFTWTPCVDLPDADIGAADLRVQFQTYEYGDAPDYMVVDLSLAAESRVQYYPDVESLPGGLLENGSYRSSKIVMRHIHASGAKLMRGTLVENGRSDSNEHLHEAQLTNDYWMAVFETTFAQIANFGASAWLSVKPAKNYTWDNIRGDALKYSWPYTVAGDSYIGRLRARTGVSFDLPSETQWEYACRAGNGEGLWNEGSPVLSSSGADLAHFGKKWSSTDCGVMVGSFNPNSWGLYDMHGNIAEFCLDWYQKDVSGYGGKVNSEGALALDGNSCANKTVRGGCFTSAWSDMRSASRAAFPYASCKHEAGFRLCSAYGFQSEELLPVASAE